MPIAISACIRIARELARIASGALVNALYSELTIHKLQDADCNDLDLDFRVSDVFSDKTENKANSIVRVIQASKLRESSIPPESGLRSKNWRNCVVPRLARIKEMPSERSNKRLRIEANVVEDSDLENERFGRREWSQLNGQYYKSDHDGDDELTTDVVEEGKGIGMFSPELGERISSSPHPRVRTPRSVDFEIIRTLPVSQNQTNRLAEVKEEMPSSPIHSHSALTLSLASIQPTEVHQPRPRIPAVDLQQQPSPACSDASGRSTTGRISTANSAPQAQADIYDALLPAKQSRVTQSSLNNHDITDGHNSLSPSVQLPCKDLVNHNQLEQGQFAQEQQEEQLRTIKDRARHESLAKKSYGANFERKECGESEAYAIRERAARAVMERQRLEERQRKEKELTKEREEQDRLAKEHKEQERLVKKKQEEESFAREREDKQRQTKQKPKEEQLARQEKKEGRLSKKAEEERLAKQRQEMETRPHTETVRQKAENKLSQGETIDLRKAPQEKKQVSSKKSPVAEKLKSINGERGRKNREAKHTEESEKNKNTNKRQRSCSDHSISSLERTKKSRTEPTPRPTSRADNSTQKPITRNSDEEMAPPPAPNSAIRRSSLKSGDQAIGRRSERKGVAFAEQPLLRQEPQSSQVSVMSTPTPISATRLVKRTPIPIPSLNPTSNMLANTTASRK